MICSKCKQAIEDGVKFCNHCGHDQQKSVEQPQPPHPQEQGTPDIGQGENLSPHHLYPQEQWTHDMGQGENLSPNHPYPQEQGHPDMGQGENLSPMFQKERVSSGYMEEKKKSSLFAIIFLGVAVLVLGIGAYSLWNAPKLVVATAVANTSSTFYHCGKVMIEDLPLYSFFKDIKESQYSAVYETNALDFHLEMDYQKEQVKVSMQATGDADLALFLSKNYTTIEISDSAIGFTNANLARDLNHCVFAEVKLNENYVFDPFAFETSLIENLVETSTESLTTLMTDVQVEKQKGTKTILVDGVKEKVNLYEIHIPSGDVEKALGSVVDTLVYDPSFSHQLEQFFWLKQAEDPATYSNVKDFTLAVEATLRDFVSDVITEYQQNGSYFVLYIHDRQVVGLEDASGERIVTFANTENPWEDVIFYNNQDIFSFSMSTKDKVFAFKFQENDKNIWKITYDYGKTTNNFMFYKGIDLITLSIDSSGRNKLDVEINEKKIYFEKDMLEEGWFQQNLQFTPFLELSKLELGLLLLTEFPTLMYLF